MLVATEALARQLERIATGYLVTRHSGPGNPMGTQFLRIGTGVATKVPYVPANPGMNCMHGLEDAAALPQVLEFYAATQQCCWIDVVP